MWLGRSSEFYNRSITSWLQDNNIKMYSTHIEEKLKGRKSANILLQYQKNLFTKKFEKLYQTSSLDAHIWVSGQRSINFLIF